MLSQALDDHFTNTVLCHTTSTHTDVTNYILKTDLTFNAPSSSNVLHNS